MIRLLVCCLFALILISPVVTLTGQQLPSSPSGILSSESIADPLPTASAHASTIVETADGLVAAWFGGTREGASDVGIWLSRRVEGRWTAPVEVATGRQSDGLEYPAWNPVLFQEAPGALHLYFKVGPAPARWWGMVVESADNGRTWSEPKRLPDGFLGPIKNKPLRLADGTVIFGSSTESTDADPVWRVHFELMTGNGRMWSAVWPAVTGGVNINAIQPSILVYSDGRLQAIGRTRSSRLFETWSSDHGRTWTALALLDVPNPNSGIDAVTLADGRQVLVYNNTTTGRTPLSVAVSRDGRAWTMVAALETGAGEFSYPAVIQTRDGRVHVTYTWQRRNIRHAVLDPSAWPK